MFQYSNPVPQSPFIVFSDDEPATSTGTLIIHLSDVNDNAPVLEQRKIQMCSTEPEPALLTITDQDGPGNSLPFHVELHSEYQNNWTVIVNSSGTTTTAKTSNNNHFLTHL